MRSDGLKVYILVFLLLAGKSGFGDNGLRAGEAHSGMIPVINSLPRNDEGLSKNDEPSPLVKAVVGWDCPDRTFSEVQLALNKIRLQERDTDLSDVDMEALKAFFFALNKQYAQRRFPDDIQVIKDEIRRLEAVHLNLPKSVRDQIPAELLPIAKEMTWSSFENTFDADRDHFRSPLAGLEDKAFIFAVANRDTLPSETCRQFLVLLEEKTREHYQNKSVTESELSLSDKNFLLEWGYSVENSDSLCYVVDILIVDTTIAPHVSNPEVMGSPARFCDKAYNAAGILIVGSDEWALRQKAHIFPLDNVKNRSEKLARFEDWWGTHKHNLEFDEKIGRFVVRKTSASKGNAEL